VAVDKHAAASIGEGHVPDVVAPPPGNPRFPMFDGLRAIAALSVLVHHAAYFSGYESVGKLGPWLALLSAGVILFFVISGFLLYRPFVAADLTGRKPTAVSTFYRRRLLRIIPAYWLALTVIALLPYNAAMFDHWPRYYFLFQIYLPGSQAGIPQAWSLSVELAFYLLIPIYAMAMRSLQRQVGIRSRIKIEAVLLVLLSAISAVVAWRIDHGDSELWALPVSCIWWFVIGMGLALVSAQIQAGTMKTPRVVTLIRSRSGASWLLALVVLVASGCLVSLIPPTGWLDPDSKFIWWIAGGLIAFLLAAPAIFTEPGSGGIPGRFLSVRFVAWLGIVSYGVYLWQIAPMDWLSDGHLGLDLAGWTVRDRFIVLLAVSLAFTIPVAALSYYLIEKPFLRLKFSKKNRTS